MAMIDLIESSAGFFFGMRRSIDAAAYKPDHGYLFDPKLRILGQEQDLWDRMMAVRAHLPKPVSCARISSRRGTCASQ